MPLEALPHRPLDSGMWDKQMQTHVCQFRGLGACKTKKMLPPLKRQKLFQSAILKGFVNYVMGGI